jgi:hypothetical protein
MIAPAVALLASTWMTVVVTHGWLPLAVFAVAVIAAFGCRSVEAFLVAGVGLGVCVLSVVGISAGFGYAPVRWGLLTLSVVAYVACVGLGAVPFVWSEADTSRRWFQSSAVTADVCLGASVVAVLAGASPEWCGWSLGVLVPSVAWRLVVLRRPVAMMCVCPAISTLAVLGLLLYNVDVSSEEVMLGVGIAMWVGALLSWLCCWAGDALALRRGLPTFSRDTQARRKVLLDVVLASFTLVGAGLVGVSGFPAANSAVGCLIALAVAFAYRGTVMDSKDLRSRYVALGLLAGGLAIAGACLTAQGEFGLHSG